MLVPRRAFYRLAAVALAAAAALACHETTAPNLQVVVSVYQVAGPNLSADSIGFPVITCDVQLSAQASGSGSAEWGDAKFYFFTGTNRAAPADSGLISAYQVKQGWGKSTIAAGDFVTAGWRFSADIPFSVALAYSYQASGGPIRTAGVAFSCGPDSIPNGPAPVITTAAPDTSIRVGPGASAKLDLVASSAAGLWATVVDVVGPGTCSAAHAYADSLAPTISRALLVPIPARCPIGAKISLNVTVVDAALRQASQWVALPPLVDATPPVVTAVLAPRAGIPLWSGTPGVFAGDTMRVTVTATDDDPVTYLIWTVTPGGWRDSLRVSSDSLRQVLPVVARPEWAMSSQVWVSARDSSGNTSTPVEAGGVLIYPTDTTAVTAAVAGQIADVAFDGKRRTIDLLQTDSSRIAIFSPATLAVTSTIALPDRPYALDLSVSGDSLVAAGQGALEVVDLLASPAAVSEIPIAYLDTLPGWHPAAVAVAANGDVLVEVVSADLYQSALVEVNLATGEQRRRPEMYGGGGRPVMVRATDHSVVFVEASALLRRYDAATDAFSGILQVDAGERPATDGAGDLVTLGYALFNADLAVLAVVTYQIGQEYPEPILSTDGQVYAVYDTAAGVVRTNIADRRTLGRTALPFAVSFLRAAPDTATLVAVQNNSGPPSLIAVLSQHQPGVAAARRERAMR